MFLFKNPLKQMNQITYVIVTFDLSNMMPWILIGPNQNLVSEYPDNSFDNSVPVETQFVIQSFKTKRQIRYNSVLDSQCQVSNYV